MIGVAGGFRPAGPAQTAKPNTWIELERFKIKVIDARAGVMDAGFGRRQNRLAVRLLVENIADKSATVTEFQRGVLASKPGGRANEVAESKVRTAGGTESHFHPRIPAEIELYWNLPEGASMSQVVVSLRKWKLLEETVSASEPYWVVEKNGPPEATVTLPVQQGATS